MAARADILVENFAPGVMDRLGVGAVVLQALNPRLIYGSSSGYGKSGPYANYPAMDLVMQAMRGHPEDRSAFERERAAECEEVLDPLGRAIAAMGEQAMVAHTDAHIDGHNPEHPSSGKPLPREHK